MAEAATATPPKEGPDQTLTIETIIDTATVENKKGGEPHKRYKVKVKEHPAFTFGMFIPSFQKWAPAEGQPVTGEVKNGNYGWEISRKAPGGGGAARGKSPEEQAAIQRQHSQGKGGGIELYRLARDEGVLPKPEDSKQFFAQLRSIFDWLDDDIKAGSKRALAK